MAARQSPIKPARRVRRAWTPSSQGSSHGPALEALTAARHPQPIKPCGSRPNAKTSRHRIGSGTPSHRRPAHRTRPSRSGCRPIGHPSSTLTTARTDRREMVHVMALPLGSRSAAGHDWHIAARLGRRSAARVVEHPHAMVRGTGTHRRQASGRPGQSGTSSTCLHAGSRRTRRLGTRRPAR